MEAIGLCVLPYLILTILMIIVILWEERNLRIKNPEKYKTIILIFILITIIFGTGFYYTFLHPYELNVEVDPNEHELNVRIDFFNDWTFSSDAAGNVSIQILNSNGTIIWESINIDITFNYSYHLTIDWIEMYPSPSENEDLKIICWFNPGARFQKDPMYLEQTFTKP